MSKITGTTPPTVSVNAGAEPRYEMLFILPPINCMNQIMPRSFTPPAPALA
ncbi:hypothetical protein D3C87_2019920 [compost metagenome]